MRTQRRSARVATLQESSIRLGVGHRIRILIADDYVIFREGLAKILCSEIDFDIIASEAPGTEAILAAERTRPDVVLLGLSGRGVACLEMIHTLASRVLDARLIVLAEQIADDEVIEMLQQGAHGVVSKGCAVEELFKCIRRVRAGEYWVARNFVPALVRALIEYRASARSGRDSGNPSALTPREREILALIAAGCSNKDIAAQCSIGRDTVKHHLTSIFSKTGVTSRLELALFAVKRRGIDAA